MSEGRASMGWVMGADSLAASRPMRLAVEDRYSIQAAFVATGDATCYDVTMRSEDEGIDERSWATAFSFDILTVLPPAV